MGCERRFAAVCSSVVEAAVYGLVRAGSGWDWDCMQPMVAWWRGGRGEKRLVFKWAVLSSVVCIVFSF